MKNILFILFVSVFVLKHPFYAQNKTMDSLNFVLKNTKHDTTRLGLYFKLCEVCEVSDNLKYADPALKLVDKLLIKNQNKAQRKILLSQKANAYDMCSLYYNEDKTRNLDKVIEYREKALALYQEIGDKIAVAGNLKYLGECYGAQGNYLKELDNFKKSLTISEQLKDTAEIASTNFSIGSIYFSQKDTSLALSYFEKSLIKFKHLKDTSKMAFLLVKIGTLYECKKNHVKANLMINEGLPLIRTEKDTSRLAMSYTFFAQIFMDAKLYDQAIENLDLSYKLIQGGDTSFFGSSFNAMGKCYFWKDNYIKAIEYYKRGLKMAVLQKNPSMEAQSLIGLANSSLKLHKNKEAVDYASRALPIRKMEGLPVGLMYAEKAKYMADSSIGNFKGAFEHKSNFMILREKLNGDDIQKEGLKQKFKEDYEKEKEKAQLEQAKKDVQSEEEKQQQRIILYSVSIGLFLVLLLVLFVFRGLKQKQKDNAIITQQKNEVEKSKHIIEEKHKEITDSINYAERIQRTFLATDELLNQYLHNYFILFKPKDVVSGDFYWADTLPNGNFILATADSTGHGVPGAIMSLLNITSLEKAVEHLTNPAEILNHTRQTIIKRLKRDGSAEGGKDGMDCSLIIFDIKNKQLHIAAANNPVWIIRKRDCEGDSLKQSQTIDEIASLPRNDESLELIEIKPDKMPVGKHDRDQETFTAHTLDIKEGDIIYTLTDGFPDQFGGDKGKKFMTKNLKDLLLANAHLPMNEQKEILHQTFTKWVGNLEQVDDVTLIGIKL
jgi:serine phosphatase RsbU (regulator of sigma subunit)